MCFACWTTHADSVVVFNEVMFAPLGEERSLEWLEIHNEMAVDVDVSHWRVSGGIQFEFVEGSIIPGGGYSVIAASPATLAAANGLTNVLGPFTGRLSNSGDLLQLRNHNDRVMDELVYGVDGEWPVGPHGSGMSLSKRDEAAASNTPRSWTVSASIGGTPGRPNFAPAAAEVTQSRAISLDSNWHYAASAPVIDPSWRQPGFDDSQWKQGQGLFGAGNTAPPTGEPENIPTLFSTGLSASGALLPPGSPDPHYLLTESAQGTPPPPPVAATVIQNHPAWAANDPGSSWIGPVNPGTANVAAGVYNYRTTFTLEGFDASSASVSFRIGADNRLNSVLLNGVSRDISYAGFATLSPEFTVAAGFNPGLNTLDFFTANDTTERNPAGFRLQMRGQARRQSQVATPLTTSAVHYFRTPFVFRGATQQASIELRAVLADGAVFYLNGNEVQRWNMPAGPVTGETLALSNVFQTGLLGPWSIPAATLVSGTNVFAVELHPGPASDSSLFFGGELSVTSTNGGSAPSLPLVLNEVASQPVENFFVELMNTGAVPIEVGGCAVSSARGAEARTYRLPAQVLGPGSFLPLSEAVLGFGTWPG